MSSNLVDAEGVVHVRAYLRGVYAWCSSRRGSRLTVCETTKARVITCLWCVGRR